MYQIAKFYPRKSLKRRRKLRPLVQKIVPEPKQKPMLQYVVFLCFLFVGISLGIYYNDTNKVAVWKDFLSSYRNQYNMIVHGKHDYCQSGMNTTRLFTDISTELLNQASALRKIEEILKNETYFTALAIAGTPGVGKSLFVQLLEDFFPWQENTQTYSWSDYNTPGQKREDVMAFVNHLSECGRNLIVIDNLRTDDLEMVKEYNKFVKNFMNETKGRYSLILVYVFNVPKYTYEHWEQYEEKMEVLRQLEDIEIVHFRNFNTNDLDACIRHEAQELNLAIDRKGIDEIMKSIDVERSGCKNVRSKVLTYGGGDDIFVYL